LTPVTHRQLVVPTELFSGHDAEILACTRLEQAGLHLLCRNYRCPRGEIDLIMNDGGILVFVEVRYRRSSAYGSAAESVDKRKQSRLLAAAQHYLMNNQHDAPCRFDVVAINGAASPGIEWLRDAFRPD
jgi:putative endonuclease